MLCGFRRILIGEAFVWKHALGVADTLGEIWSRVLTPVHFPTPTSCDIMCSDMIGHLLFRKCCLNFSPTVPLLSLFLFQNNLYTASVLTCTPLFKKKKKKSNFSIPWHVFFRYMTWNSGGQGPRPSAWLVHYVSFGLSEILDSYVLKRQLFQHDSTIAYNLANRFSQRKNNFNAQEIHYKKDPSLSKKYPKHAQSFSPPC